MKAFTTLLLIVFGFTFNLHAQATLSIQGTIQKSFGGAVDDGKYSLTFKLYTTESGGTAVWSETQDGVEVIGGVYSALLGAANPLNAGFNSIYYLGIAVDGGQELTPRTKLTSAPYSLSLIGQSNIFPSAGSVGIGTVTPDGAASLQVYKSDGNVKQMISTSADYSANLLLNAGQHSGYLNVNKDAFTMQSDDKSINIVPSSDGQVQLYGQGSLKANTDSAGLVVSGRMVSSGSISTQNGNISSANNVDLKLYRGTDRHILLRGDGYTEFNKCIYVPGSVNISWGGSGILRAAGSTFVGESGFATYSMSVNGQSSIATGQSFIIYSDARIKKDLKLSNGKTDLATLMNLEVTDYRRKDYMEQGTNYQKGFIAQQVETVFPEAVSKYTDAIPNIYTFPTGLEVKGAEATFRLENAHTLQVGDRVRIYLKDDNSQELYEVVQVQGDRSFTVKDWKGGTEAANTFVFGKEVHDFRRVDYDRIHTLNVSATQELARRVTQLEAENAALRTKNGAVEQQNQNLRSDLDGLNARLSKLESLLTSNANR